MKQKKYEINGKSYTQRPLVLGQIMPLVELIDGIEFPELKALAIVRALGPVLPRALAIVLIPDDVDIADRDLEAMEREFFSHMGFETALEVAEDFLSFNVASSVLKKLKALTSVVVKNLTETVQEISSLDSSESSVEETSPSETGSSGTSPGEKPESGPSSESSKDTSG